MKNVKLTRVLAAAVIIPVVVLSLMGLRALWAPPGPSVVAVVDLPKLINGLEAKAEKDAQIKEMVAKLEAERDAKFAELERLAQELETLVEGTDRYLQCEVRAKQMLIDAKTFAEYSKMKVDAYTAEHFRTLYESVKTAVAKFATIHGIDFVVLDDSVVEIKPGTQEEIRAQISARRVLYANSSNDITNQLLTFMNEQ